MQSRIIFIAASALLLVAASTLAFVVDASEKRQSKKGAAAPYRVSRNMKIINIMMENRAFDHLLGWSGKTLNVDGLTGKEYNPVSTLDPNSYRVYVSPDAPQRAPMDPDHATYAYTDKIFGLQALLSKNYTDETMMGFVEWETIKRSHPDNKTTFSVMGGFSAQTLPVLTQLASEYAVFDRFFAAVPGSTWPNRIAALAAATGSQGAVQTTETFFFAEGEPGKMYTMKTILDQLVEDGLDWQIAYQDSLWENFFQVIAENPQKTVQLPVLFDQLARCTVVNCALPAYTFVNPRGGVNVTTNEGANDMHPSHLVYLAEKLYRDLYQHVVASPLWESGDLMLIVSFDEGGGFFDHVPPPIGVPAPWPGKIRSFPDFFFDFTRLGARIPLIVVSPLVKKGTVVSAPPEAQKPQPNSAYDHTSILSTIRKWLGMPGTPLSQRDAWAATFEHVLNLDTPRTDCPKTLVPPYRPSSLFTESEEAQAEADMPITSLQREIMQHAHYLTNTHPLRTTPHPDTLSKQGEVSEWLQTTQHEHKKFHELHRMAVRATEAEVELVVGPSVSLIWAFGDINWQTVNGSACGAPDRWTISTMRKKANHSQAPLCMSHNVSTLSISVVPCYPSADPCANRHASTWWSVRGDATVRPLSAPTLGMTTPTLPSPNGSPVYLRPVNPSTRGYTQNWGFNLNQMNANAAPGEIMMGDGVFILGVKLKIL